MAAIILAQLDGQIVRREKRISNLYAARNEQTGVMRETTEANIRREEEMMKDLMKERDELAEHNFQGILLLLSCSTLNCFATEVADVPSSSMGLKSACMILYRQRRRGWKGRHRRIELSDLACSTSNKNSLASFAKETRAIQKIQCIL